MRTNDLDYELPSESIAQDPAAVRSDSRMLVVDRSTGLFTDSRFSRIGEFLRAGDCLVLNDTKVLPARFFARRETGGKLEGLFLCEASTAGADEVLASRPAASRPVEERRKRNAAGATPKRGGPPELSEGLSVSSPATEHLPASTVKQVWPCHPNCQLPGSEATKQSPNATEPTERGARVWEVMLKGARKVKLDESIHIEDRNRCDFCTARVVEKKQDGVCRIEVETQADAEAVLNEVGFPPLPPYIRRDHDLARAESDLRRYQTVYARCPGAVAAPTAGLHFTGELMAQLKAAGIEFAYVTLHVGAGTFKPIATEQVEEHEIHREWYRLDAANADALHAAHRRGGRIIAVGTTVTRVLETVANVGWASAPADNLAADAQGQHGLKPILPACEGTTNLFITPGYEFKIVDAMVTNFHLPRSTLLALVGAFAGLERTLAAYRHAIEQRYRFYSYGDAMLIA